LGVTPTHLSRVMRGATGQPATAAIQDRIIREARRNLAYSNLSVSQIAYGLGYDDPAHFSRVFRRATGLSPSEFRRKSEAAG
ncbi:MAG: AraC family transcriptional regulator, partial [Maritimibacter sp.]|nr:AraC family transcriptional regulator [Maritimibacter sp.]